MTEQEIDRSKQKLWYVQRKGQIQGPFPCGTIRRFVLLGRVEISDQVSLDKKSWKPVSTVPDVVPPEVRRAMKEGNLDELVVARMREDERTGVDRRAAKDPSRSKGRRASDRRQDEDELAKKHRQARKKLQELENRKRKQRPIFALIMAALLVGAGIGGGIYVGAPDAIPEPDCAAQPAPSVNWRNCRLIGLHAEGADLSGAVLNNAILRQGHFYGALFVESDLMYADLSASDLSYAAFSSSSMKGVNLQRADLTNADMMGADLSFANFHGARIGGLRLDSARLDNAIWADGSICAVGSIGKCLQK
jgi:uncharacterized protein YjbI with pentapeptide repeats